MPMPQPGSGPAASGAPAPAITDGSSDDAGHADAGSGLSAAALNGQGKPAEPHQPSSAQPARKWTLSAILAAAKVTVRHNWLASALIVVGLVLRLLVQASYQPAIVYVDSLKYLYNAWPGSDPIAYKIPLKMILAFGGDLSTVELVQHLLGIAIAVTLYAVLVRRGTPRWLAALAIAPVLLDGYQLQAEAMIMPDVWFEAMIVAGLAVLLWRKQPALPTLIIGAALLGASTGVRQIGEIMIVPAVIFVVVLGGGLRKVLTNVAAVVGAFVLAIVLYMGSAYVLTHHFRISYSSSSLVYGRMSAVVDCRTLTIPPAARLLCPTKWEQAQGPDWLQHASQGPLRTFRVKLAESQYASQGANHSALVDEFNRAVERQQPLRVIRAILRDSVKLFALTRDTSPGDTPIWRWQFHGYFPTFQQYTQIRHNLLYIRLPHSVFKPIRPAYGGRPTVDVGIARFMRAYQINGGYTPGPLLALCLITGLIGSVLLAFRRRMTPEARDLGVACLTLLVAAVAVLGMSDVFEFTWRYQLPGIVILPAAGALGIAVIMLVVRRRREQASAQAVPERAPELATPAQ